jgi:cytidylate kinase
LDDEEALVTLCARLHALDFKWGPGGTVRVLLGGRDITKHIRGEEAGRWASDVSRHPEVRAALLGLQRSFSRKGPLVTEGRDTGTVVFPGALWKVFLSASLEERARRRLKEMGLEETEENMEEIKRAISERDNQDSNRAVAPLRRAPDALELDTTGLSLEEVLERIKNFMGLEASA